MAFRTPKVIVVATYPKNVLQSRAIPHLERLMAQIISV